jgi:hypothetical protein
MKVNMQETPWVMPELENLKIFAMAGLRLLHLGKVDDHTARPEEDVGSGYQGHVLRRPQVCDCCFSLAEILERTLEG